MREEDRRLFPLVTVGSVVQLFRQQLTGGEEEPDLTLLSVVAGFVENCMTAIKMAPTQTSKVRQSQIDQHDTLETNKAEKPSTGYLRHLP